MHIKVRVVETTERVTEFDFIDVVGITTEKAKRIALESVETSHKHVTNGYTGTYITHRPVEATAYAVEHTRKVG